MEQYLGRLHPILVVLAESSVGAEPGEGALHNTARALVKESGAAHVWCPQFPASSSFHQPLEARLWPITWVDLRPKDPHNPASRAVLSCTSGRDVPRGGYESTRSELELPWSSAISIDTPLLIGDPLHSLQEASIVGKPATGGPLPILDNLLNTGLKAPGESIDRHARASSDLGYQ